MVSVGGEDLPSLQSPRRIVVDAECHGSILPYSFLQTTAGRTEHAHALGFPHTSHTTRNWLAWPESRTDCLVTWGVYIGFLASAMQPDDVDDESMPNHVTRRLPRASDPMIRPVNRPKSQIALCDGDVLQVTGL